MLIYANDLDARNRHGNDTLLNVCRVCGERLCENCEQYHEYQIRRETNFTNIININYHITMWCLSFLIDSMLSRIIQLIFIFISIVLGYQDVLIDASTVHMIKRLMMTISILLSTFISTKISTFIHEHIEVTYMTNILIIIITMLLFLLLPIERDIFIHKS